MTTELSKCAALIVVIAIAIITIYRNAYNDGYKRGNLDGWREANEYAALSRETEDEMSVHSDYEHGYLTDEEYENALQTEYANEDAFGNERRPSDDEL